MWLVWLTPLEMLAKAMKKVAVVAGVLFLTGLAASFLPSGCGFEEGPDAPLLTVPTDTNVVEVPKAELTDANVVETACELIYQGKFEAAGELIQHRLSLVSGLIDAGQSSQDAQAQQRFLSGLDQIVKEYSNITKRRKDTREKKCAETLAELEKLRVATDTNDVNDVNDISKVFLVIAKVCEFADQAQRKELLCEPFVNQTIEKALGRAAELEAEGKWLDAYRTCYWWLTVLDKDKKAYAEHSEQLIEKANIAAAFQDSPCETSEEHYAKVKKQMFVRTIDVLNDRYVGIIDYHQMAKRAIRRCKLLTEEWERKTRNRAAVLQKDGKEARQSEFKSEGLADWSAALATILDEVNQSLLSMSKVMFIDVFEEVLELNTATVEMPQTVLIAQFAEASLRTLDPYTVMVWPKQTLDFEKSMTGEFVGIGILISKEKGLLTAVSLLPDTPAYRSGLDAGDMIEKVDGVETKDMTLTCAVKMITGPVGTKVTLTIRSPGEEKAREITITRDRIIVQTIRGWQRTEDGKWLYMIDERNKIGYVRISNFAERTASDLEKVLGQLEAEGLLEGGLIVDLRFNSGGALNSAIEVADKFIKEGTIVITHPNPRYWASSTYASARQKNTHPNYPLAVLTDSHSASGSEIVAGALADKTHNRAILVGERTYGKSSVQTITSRPGGGAQLKYTMAYWYLPSGHRVPNHDEVKKAGRKDWGIKPNVEVELGGGSPLTSDELKRMMDVQRDNDVLVKTDHDSGAEPLKKHTVEETLAADPQLAVGVLVIKTKLIQAASLERQG